MADEEGRNDWVRAMVPDKEEYSGHTNYYTKRNDGHVGLYCKNVTGAFGAFDCEIYEWKAVSQPNGEEGRHYVVYIGRTYRESKTDLKDRIKEYCTKGSHLHSQIDDALEKGYELYVRVKEIKNGDDEKAMVDNAEKALLSQYNYAWNKANNAPYRGETVPPKIQNNHQTQLTGCN